MNEEIVILNNGEITIEESIVNKIKEFNKLKKEIEYQEKLLKDGLMKAMEAVGKKNFAMNGLSATIKAGSTRTSIDTTRLKSECPDIWEAYSKTTEVKPSIVLTISD